MVNTLGINVPLVAMLVVAIGTWLAGLAGTANSPITRVFPGLADHIWRDVFVVVIVGGLGSLAGVFACNWVWSDYPSLEAKGKSFGYNTFQPFPVSVT